MKTSKNEMIYIGPDWALEGTSRCLTLKKRHVSENGKEYFREHGHYPDFHTAYKAMVQKEIGPLNNVEKIIKAIDNLYEFARSRCISRV